MKPPTLSVSVSIAGRRMDLTPAGLKAVYEALDVGASDFGMSDDTAAEEAETEAWEFIDLVKGAMTALDEAQARHA